MPKFLAGCFALERSDEEHYVRIKLVVGATFVIAGGLCGAAGVLQVARAGGANPHLADSILLPALAAAFLSAAAIRPGRYNVGLPERLVGMRLLKDTPVSFAFEACRNRCRRDTARGQRRCKIEKHHVELRGTGTADCAH